MLNRRIEDGRSFEVGSVIWQHGFIEGQVILVLKDTRLPSDDFDSEDLARTSISTPPRYSFDRSALVALKVRNAGLRFC